MTTQTKIQSAALNKTLKANAMFSCLSGIALIVGAEQFDALMGVGMIEIFYVVGVGLQFFALDLVMNARSKNGIPAWRAYGFSVSDFAWVLASAVVIFIPGLLTFEGKVLVGAVAVVVFILGELQLIHTMRFTKQQATA